MKKKLEQKRKKTAGTIAESNGKYQPAITVKEHFKAIAKATEEYRREELSSLTDEEAIRWTEEFLRSVPPTNTIERKDNFIPLRDMIKKHKNDTSRKASNKNKKNS